MTPDQARATADQLIAEARTMLPQALAWQRRCSDLFRDVETSGWAFDADDEETAAEQSVGLDRLLLAGKALGYVFEDVEANWRVGLSPHARQQVEAAGWKVDA